MSGARVHYADITNLLRQRGPLCATEIAYSMGVPRERVRVALCYLRNELTPGNLVKMPGAKRAERQFSVRTTLSGAQIARERRVLLRRLTDAASELPTLELSCLVIDVEGKAS